MCYRHPYRWVLLRLGLRLRLRLQQVKVLRRIRKVTDPTLQLMYVLYLHYTIGYSRGHFHKMYQVS